jgi:hypothetical protein
MALEPPVEEEYPSLEHAESVVCLHARLQGYALTRRNLVKDKRKPPTVRRRDMRCSKGGVKRGEGVLRDTGTRMTECPFEIRILRTEWGTWKVQVHNGDHNHDASINDSEHSQYRRPADTEVSAIRSLHGSGVAPRNIVANLLEQNSHTLVTSREVYNVISKQRKERLQGLSPIEALIKEIDRDPEDLWALEYTTDGNGHVNFLFIAPCSQIELAQQFPDVAFIDATYRTNRYNMPLIHFMVVTSYRKTVSVAMCFVASEEEAMYSRAVKAFKTLVMGDAKIEVFLTDDDSSLKAALSLYYPDTAQLLCLWHVNKNVEEKVNKTWRINTSNEDNEENKEKRKAFMAEWNNVSIKQVSVSQLRRGARGQEIALIFRYRSSIRRRKKALKRLI